MKQALNFDQLVEEACEQLPDWVVELLEEAGIAIYVREEPPPPIKEKFGCGVRGLFTGRNYSSTQSNRPTTQPTRIEIYRRPILRQYTGPEKEREEKLKEQVRKTIVHEVGHYLGMSEEEIRQRGY